MDVARLVSAAGGIASRRLLLEAGVTRAQLAVAVRSGHVVDHGRGGCALPDLARAFGVAARVRGAVGCISALRWYGIALPPGHDIPHVVCRSTRSAPGAVWHRGRVDGPVEPIVRAAARAVGCLPRHDALAVCDAVLRTSPTSRRDLEQALGGRPGEAARWVLRHADPRAESRLESLTRAALIDGGITGIDLQAQLVGIGRVDFLVDGWLIVEADGFGSHSNRPDYRRDTSASRQGYVTLRFSWEDVLGSPDKVARSVATVLSRRRRSGFRTAV